MFNRRELGLAGLEECCVTSSESTVYRPDITGQCAEYGVTTCYIPGRHDTLETASTFGGYRYGGLCGLCERESHLIEYVAQGEICRKLLRSTCHVEASEEISETLLEIVDNSACLQ